MSSTAVTQVGAISAKLKAKDCAVDCASGSMNLGIIKRSSVCCNTDRCNLHDAPDPSIDSNGKKCYFCDGKNCSNTVSCSGSEDHCITSTASYGELLVIKGCASKSICDTVTSVNDVQRTSCCSGNLCNGVQSVTQSFLFLCCSLLSFILLH
ncbi:hypothetical protein G5714_020929 [Onychostoma macrolepis]|uniref:Snake toxin/toxin-like domain-containing protein n=2 Tax=Onychostoma macrolepis TaxID=369639 RepID=A0A7J6BV85_9TELE|nr:hypothetical protein G5714_020929 [Onychostoma macrolepis]